MADSSIEWTGDTTPVEVTDLLAKSHAALSYLIREAHSRSAAFVNRKVQDQKCLSSLGSEVGQHPSTQQLCAGASNGRSMLNLEARLAPSRRSAVGLLARLMLNGSCFEEFADPLNRRQICHRPADGRVVGVVAVGVGHVDAAVAVRKARQVRGRRFVKQGDRVRWVPSVTFGSLAKVALPVVRTLDRSGISGRSVLAHALDLTPARSIHIGLLVAS